MFKILGLSLLAMLLSMLLLFLGVVINKKSPLDYFKESPFECGFSPRSTSRMPFSLQFFLVSLIFVIFDIELIIFYPIVLFPVSMWSFMPLVMLLLFLCLLTFGLFHEWARNLLDWTS